jgi:23S rRNA pseudouridine1911/1915/1917 synthase
MKKSIPLREFLCDTPGLRLDRFLAARLPDYSRAVLKGFIQDSRVLVDARAAKPNLKLKGGERISVSFPENSWQLPIPAENWIVYEDKQLIVINKPAGIIMHPLKNSWLTNPQASLWEKEPSVAGVFYRLRPEIVKAGVSRLGLVHRLDRQTSGILLLAKTKDAQKSLLRQFKERSVEKRYQAIARGKPLKENIRVVAPIGHAGMSRNFVATPFGKPAETEFKILKTAPHAALVEARPKTGRTHQIRAHLAFAGFPVAGDFLFDKENRAPIPPRLMLHAFQISFLHPQTGKNMIFKAPLPEDFNCFWRACVNSSGKKVAA